MIYLVFATQTPPPGHLERMVFVHPGNAQQVQQFAQQLIGAQPKVPYQVANLAARRPERAAVYCRQMTPMALPAGVTQGMADGQQLGAPAMPTDLKPARPEDNTAFNVGPSPLGPQYGQLPSDLAGDL